MRRVKVGEAVSDSQARLGYVLFSPRVLFVNLSGSPAGDRGYLLAQLSSSL